MNAEIVDHIFDFNCVPKHSLLYSYNNNNIIVYIPHAETRVYRFFEHRPLIPLSVGRETFEYYNRV